MDFRTDILPILAFCCIVGFLAPMIGLGSVLLLRRFSRKPAKEIETVVPVNSSQPEPALFLTDSQPDTFSTPDNLQPPSISDFVPPPEGWLEEGKEKFRQGLLQPAYASLLRATQALPQDAEAWIWLGWVTARLDNAPEARLYFRAADLGHPQAAQSLEMLDNG